MNGSALYDLGFDVSLSDPDSCLFYLDMLFFTILSIPPAFVCKFGTILGDLIGAPAFKLC